MPALLSVRDLTVDFATGRTVFVRAVAGVSFDLRAGEVLGIVGRSGSGKSTLALSLLGLLPAAARLTGGSALWDGRDLFQLRESQRRALRGREIAMIFQDPLSALHPSLPVIHQVAEALRVYRPDLDRHAARRGAVDRLARVGISRPEDRIHDYPHQWSGGMRQRAMIAIALVHQPRLLIADEPTTALDVTVQARIIELLRREAPAAGGDGSEGATLLITHDFGLIAELADRVLVMMDGKIVDQGSTMQIFNQPGHPHTADLLAARPGVSTGTRTGRHPGGGDAAADPPVLEVRGLSAEYAPVSRAVPPVRAVDDVSFRLGSGEVLGLVGKSGSGKTSLARALVGLLPASGDIRLAGCEITAATRRTRAHRRAMQIVFQNPYGSLNPRRSVGASIAEPLRIHGLHAKYGNARVEELLQIVELDPSFSRRFPAELSGGEQQRVAIARALACQPRVVILDEPVTSLDVAVQARILALLDRLRRELRTAFLLIAHDLRMVRDVADRVAVMEAGRLVEVGPTRRMFERPEHAETRRLLAAIPAIHPSGRARGPAGDTAMP